MTGLPHGEYRSHTRRWDVRRRFPTPAPEKLPGRPAVVQVLDACTQASSTCEGCP